jgi:Na+/H+ antiporter NhaD/arsenite permease-like protein
VLTAAVILGLAYLGIAFARLPGVNIDRPSAAFAGAVLMLLLGVLTFEEAVSAIDFNTLGLLLGMMVLASALQGAGFFHLVAAGSLSAAKTPQRLLLLVVVATALSSAFLINDVVVLLFTPILLQTCRARGVDPVPYLIAEAMASNIGSVATVVGNPQNMLIGITAGIPFDRFFLYLLPVALLSTVALVLIIRLVYGRAFAAAFSGSSTPPPQFLPPDAKAIARLAPVLILVVLGFFLSSFLGLQVPLIALAGAALALLVARGRPAAVIRGVDWVLLLFFGGLFVVVGGAHPAGVLDVFLERIRLAPDLAGMASLVVVSTLVSQLISNVPLTMLVLPLLKSVPGHTLWIALAAGSTLGGNLTVVGAVANIIVVEAAAREGVRVPFGGFLRVGLVVTGVTVGLALLILAGEHRLGWLR